MATAPRFGRLPRSAPNLTSTIVSLAQQYQSDRDRNIETAWKNGGLFEGKKVTDEMFLKHWKQRLASVSSDDPMWDYYNNLIYSYEFTIEESKMGQKYAEEKVSDAQMAAFYRKWAAKMPMNSQNYRQLMTQAAKFKAAATSRGYARSSDASAKAYAARQQRTYNEKEAAYDVATSLLARYAVDADYIDSNDLNDPDYGWSKLTNSVGENDPANFADLLSDIMADENIRKGMTAIIRQYDPDFSGTFTDESLAQLANNARNGAMERARRARKAGDTAGANAADKKADTYAKSSMVVRATLGPNGKDNGFVEQNEAYRAEMDAVLSPNSGASPTERAAAIKRYSDWLAGDGTQALASSFPAGSFDPLSANYNPWASGLMGRIKGTYSALQGKSVGQTLKDDLFGFSTNEAGAESDAVTLAATTSGLFAGLENVRNGTSIIVRTDPDGKVDPLGNSWSIFNREDQQLANRELVPFAAPVAGQSQGETRYTEAVPVKARVSGAVDPRTGAGVSPLKASPLEDEIIGSRVDIRGPGGTEYTLYGIYQNGQKVWTYVDPFAAAGRGNSGREADGTYIIAYAHPEAVQPGQKTPTYSPASFIDPTAAKYRTADGLDSTDGTKWDPMTDKQTGYFSPMSALANTSSDTMKFVQSLGATAVANAEREFYSQPQNQTPEMQRLIAQGADPRAVVEAESNKLLKQLEDARLYGYTPEDQQRNRSREWAFKAQRAAAEAGTTVEALNRTNERNDIVSQLTKWGLEQREPVTVTDVMAQGGFAKGQLGGTKEVIPEYMQKGWTVGELLNQPGMSLEQANDLAYRISKGAVGKPGAPTVGAPLTGRGGGLMPGGAPTGMRQPTQPYTNPFAVVPQKPPAPPPPPRSSGDIIAANLAPKVKPPVLGPKKKAGRGAFRPVTTVKPKYSTVTSTGEGQHR